MLVTRTLLVNIGYIFSHFLILADSSFYMNEPLKGTDCLQKSFDGIFIWLDKVSFMSQHSFVYSRYRGNSYISDVPKAPPTDRERFCSDQCQKSTHINRFK